MQVNAADAGQGEAVGFQKKTRHQATWVQKGKIQLKPAENQLKTLRNTPKPRPKPIKRWCTNNYTSSGILKNQLYH